MWPSESVKVLAEGEGLAEALFDTGVGEIGGHLLGGGADGLVCGVPLRGGGRRKKKGEEQRDKEAKGHCFSMVAGAGSSWRRSPGGVGVVVGEGLAGWKMCVGVWVTWGVEMLSDFLVGDRSFAALRMTTQGAMATATQQ